MEERRQTHRYRTYKGGRINPDQGPGMDCVIRNLSDVGACLEVNSNLVRGDHFHLVIMPESLTRNCRVIWRKAQRIGVRFV